MNIKELIEYETVNQWWMGWIWFEWGTKLASRYIAWKVERKVRTYNKHLAQKQQYSDRK